jgi:hypothetical protein
MLCTKIYVDYVFIDFVDWAAGACKGVGRWVWYSHSEWQDMMDRRAMSGVVPVEQPPNQLQITATESTTVIRLASYFTPFYLLHTHSHSFIFCFVFTIASPLYPGVHPGLWQRKREVSWWMTGNPSDRGQRVTSMIIPLNSSKASYLYYWSRISWQVPPNEEMDAMTFQEASVQIKDDEDLFEEDKKIKEEVMVKVNMVSSLA